MQLDLGGGEGGPIDINIHKYYSWRNRLVIEDHLLLVVPEDYVVSKENRQVSIIHHDLLLVTE